MSMMWAMRLSLIHRACMYAIYGGPTHGMCSLEGTKASSFRALMLLRQTLAPERPRTPLFIPSLKRGYGYAAGH